MVKEFQTDGKNNGHGKYGNHAGQGVSGSAEVGTMEATQSSEVLLTNGRSNKSARRTDGQMVGKYRDS